MSQASESLFDNLRRHARRTAMLESIASALGWDERTMLPSAGAEYRAEQITLLAGMIHERWVDPCFGEKLDELAATPAAEDGHGDVGATVRQWKRARDRKVKLPQSLVEELTRAEVLGQNAWEKARREDDFETFAPVLERLVALKGQEADALALGTCRYDSLLDAYEPRASTVEVTAVLDGLRDALIPLVDAIRGSSRRPNRKILAQAFPVDRQEAFGREAAATIGYDFSRGRLDRTAHPFCCDLGPNDCRITTRYDEHQFADALFSTLHEAGHGIYDQALRKDHYRLPLGLPVSMGIHESQSRMWENFVGRSRAFWEFFFPKAKQAFPDALGGVSLDDFHFAINDVRPTLIRVDADEATYNLHILIRFELEQALLRGDLPVRDLPAAWQEKYEHYLGIKPTSFADGVLQDIHWSGGAIGYFPTYSLGNLHAAQFFAAAGRDLGDLDAAFARGEFQPLRRWLAEKIHRQGQCFTASELAKNVTGSPLSHEPLMEHLRAKLGPLYGIA